MSARLTVVPSRPTLRLQVVRGGGWASTTPRAWDYLEDDRAGDDFLGRPGLQRLVKDAQPGDVVVCRDQSRIGRKATQTTLAIEELVHERAGPTLLLRRPARGADGPPTERINLGERSNLGERINLGRGPSFSTWVGSLRVLGVRPSQPGSVVPPSPSRGINLGLESQSWVWQSDAARQELA